MSSIARKGLGWVGVILVFHLSICSQIAISQNQSHLDSDQATLTAILEKTNDYCKKLVHASLNFVCLEEIQETTTRLEAVLEGQENPFDREFRAQSRTIERKETKRYLYDYQLIRKKGRIEENRTLLEENGNKTKVPNVELNTLSVRYAKMIFGPMLLNENWQKYYNYCIVGKEKIFGENSIIIEAKPKKNDASLYLYGKIWVGENNYDVLKIEWAQESIGLIRNFEQRAKSQNAKPLITSKTEFEIEKNGIRFPSRFEYEQAFIKKDGKKKMVSETIVTYKNYKFFTVEIDVNFSYN